MLLRKHRVLIKNPNKVIQGAFSNSVIELDLPVDFGIQIRRAVSDLNRAGKIKRPSAVSTSLPKSSKNIQILESFRSPAITDNLYLPLEISFWVAHVELQFDTMEVLMNNDRSNSYEVRFLDKNSYWSDRAKETKLKDVDYGSFLFISANILSRWGGVSWSDGDPYVNFPVVDYGSRVVLGEWSVEDFRPWFSAYGVIKQAFCHFGWNFESPVLDSNWGKRLWTYILKKDWYKHSNHGHLMTVEATTSADNFADLPLIIEFDTEISDDGNNYDPVTFTYNYTGSQSATVEFCIEGTLENIAVTTQTAIIHLFDPVTVSNHGTFEIDIPPTSSETFKVCVDVPVSSGTQWQWAFTQNINIKLNAGARTTSRVVDQFLLEGDTIPLNELINEDYTLMQFLEGVAHIGGFKFHTDFGTKTVTMYQPETGDVFNNTNVEGFIESSTKSVDISNLISDNSRIIRTKRALAKRFLRYRFKKSTDKYITEILKNNEETEPLHSKIIDLGADLPAETAESTNPFFEPTVEVRKQIEDGPGLSTDFFIPTIWDNTNAEFSRNIKPRILYAVGYVTQFTEAVDNLNGAQVPKSKWIYEGVNYTALPYFTQMAQTTISNIGVSDEVIENIAYGDSSNDMYNTFLVNETKINYLLPEYSFLVRFDWESASNEDFRTKYIINYGDENSSYRLIKTNYNTGSDEEQDLTFVPEPNFTTC